MSFIIGSQQKHFKPSSALLTIMQSELLQCSWPLFNYTNSPFDEFGDCGLVMEDDMDRYDFSPPFTTTEDSSDNSIVSIFPATFPEEFMDLPVLPVPVEELDITLPENDFLMSVEEFDIEDMSESLEQSERSSPSQQLLDDGEDAWSLSSMMKSSATSMDIASIHASLILSTEDMELDNQLSAIHLVKAYGEAVDKDEKELSEVILKRIREKLSPVGEVMERLLYYLFHPSDKQTDYLKQESGKNFLAAFNAFYQIFPYGKFAHFAANKAILEALPYDVEVIHIIDFDMGEGIQWSSMIEAIGCQQREIRLTSIKWSEGDSNCDPSNWRFEETKKWLCDHAHSFGLKLTVDNMELHDLVNEIKEMKKKGGRRDWFAFNCMAGLPHMGRMRSRRDASEFLRVAKELLAYTANSSYNNMGIITFGNGDAWVNTKISSSTFGSFLDGHLVQYQALLESIEWGFPIHLGEARTALECLFVAPLISSLAWIHKWKEIDCCILQSGYGLEGWRVSKESLMEAMEMVREGESLYGVRIEGKNHNGMVLEWRGIPLLRVSCWRS